MSSTHEDQVEEAGPESDEQFQKTGSEQSSSGRSEPGSEVPEPAQGPIPIWLIGVIGLSIFWAGAYLFSFSGGFKADVFDFAPKYGAEGGGAKGAPDPKVVGKALFSANCVTCHQATGLGVPGQYPPLAGSEVELGDATNHLIAIVLKGLQGPVVVEGKPFNNAMQAWEAQYTDSQLAAILTYVRSDWGNSAPPISADMVKQIRAEFKDRKEQWTWPEIEKMPPKNLTGGAPPAAPAGQQKPGTPASGSQPPASNSQPQPAAANAQTTQPPPQSQPPAPTPAPATAP
jgi:mono/diheme cytochrome c family protein